jgi:hypothetical protein
MKIWFVLTFLSFAALAQESSDCIPIKNAISDLDDVSKHLEWHGATSTQIEKAFCKTLKPPTEKDLDNFIQSKAKGATNAVVNGISFSDESPLLIEAFEAFTTAKDGFGISAKPSLQEDFQKKYSINPECQKVRCAMEKIWGKALSEKILYLNLKHNYNASEYAFQNSDRFTEIEMDDVLMGIDDLPPHLIPMGSKYQRLTHFKRGYTLAGYGDNVVANAVIMLFDSWDTEPRREKQYTIFHEASHNASSNLKKMDESPEWLGLSSWVKTGDTWTSDPKACQVTKYGETNPWEDFAESMSTYRYNPQDFISQCPLKYKFIKDNVFKGIEYTDLKSCTPIPEGQLHSARDLIIKDIAASLKEQTFSAEDVTKSCMNTFSYPPKNEEITSCSLKLITQDQANASQRIISALQKANIPDTPANRDQVLLGMDEMVANDGELKKKMASMAKGVPEAIETIKSQSINNANAIGSGTKKLEEDSYLWRSNQEACRSLVLNTVSREELTRCHVKTILKADKESQKWNSGHFAAYKVPPIFKAESGENLNIERDKDLEALLIKQEMTKKAMFKIEADIKHSMAGHHVNVSVRLYDMDRWKQLSPQEFCSQTYGKSGSSLTTLNIKEGSPIPSIQDWCVKKQSETKKRHEFTEEEWKGYTSSLFK